MNFAIDHSCPLPLSGTLPEEGYTWTCEDCGMMWEVVTIYKARFWQPSMFQPSSKGPDHGNQGR